MVNRKLLIAVLFVLQLNVKAQRSVDWSVAEIVSPTELNSDVQTGTAVDVTLALENLGADEALEGDTILYQFFATDLSGNPLFWAPNAQNPNSFFIEVLSKNLGVNDTIHINRSVSLSIYVTSSVNILFAARSFIQNRASLSPEDTSTISNNLVVNQITWYNPQRWGVNINEIENNQLFNLYPVPAKDYIFIDPILRSTNQNLGVTLFDLTGRRIKHQSFTGKFGPFRFDLEDAQKGIYLLEINQGELRSTKRISIQ